MNYTLTITGSPEEITFAINAIKDRQERDKKILTPIVHDKWSLSPTTSNVPSKKTHGRWWKKIELKIDGERYKIFDSLKHAAEHIGCSSPQLCKKCDTWLLVQKTYTVHTYS